MADAELTARLGLDLSQFNQGMKQAEQATKQITNSLNALEREAVEVQKSFNSNQQAAEALKRVDADLANAVKDIDAAMSQAKQAAQQFTPALNQVAAESKAADNAAYELGVSIGTRMNMAFKVGAAAIAGVGTALATVGVGFYKFNKEAQEATETLNAAQRLNVNTDDLQAAQYAVQRLGLPADTLKEALQDINDKMGDLSANDGGELKDFFKRMNLDVAEFIGKSPLDILRALNQEAQNLSTTERTQLFESMGNDLSKLEPLLAANGAQFDSLMQQAIDFGHVASNANLVALDSFNQTLKDIQDKFWGMNEMVYANLAEPMKEAITYVDEWIESLGGGEVVAMQISDAIVNGLIMAVEAGGWLAKRFNEVAGITEAIVGGLALVARGAMEVAELMSHMPAMKIMDKIFDTDATKSIQLMQSKLDEIIGQARDYRTIMEDVANKNTGIDQWTDGLNSRIGAGKQAMHDTFQAQVDIGNRGELPKEVERLTKVLQDAQAEQQRLKNDDNKTTEQMTEATKAVAEATKALAEAQEKLSNARSTLDGGRQYGTNTGAVSRNLFRSNQEADASKEYGKELDKQHKELLKQQKEALAWQSRLNMNDARERDRINMEDAKAVDKANKEAERIAKLSAKDQFAASKSMSDAVGSFGKYVTDASQQAIKSASLEIKNPQMAFVRGGSNHVDQDPTGQKYLRQAYPEYYQPARIPAAGSTQNQFDTSKMQTLGVVYFTSQDGKVKAEALMTPENYKLISQIALQAVGGMARDGQLMNS
ncbi:hypothetical protein LVJ82_10800 [Vitreoscilla massiliensis]|uniref:Uncharacterized protein n=1 Tax=Vitreoscilla massiliensis TaxID=1689272 RepID=A0ABY4DY01_9NEIS|nr:hypothetical protein [Vitreoscilla massiliensis]UOO87981.1 hypothetical protein LVJ82_10800 [Vitreoscilla massiliensis]